LGQDNHDVLKRTWGFFIGATALALAVTSVVRAPGMGHDPAPLRPSFGQGEYFPYQSGAFTRFVGDSYKEADGGQVSDFYAWMDGACGRARLCSPAGTRVLAMVDSRRRTLDTISAPRQRTQAEMALASTLHHWIKTSLPTFSLEEGFEFSNVARRGERQCLLQSVLLAALLQEADIDAGVVMVYKNVGGHVSNNGHCVTLLKCSDGTDVLVDASDAQPFVRHQGVFAKDALRKEYRYAEPVFLDPRSPIIVSYQNPAHDAKATTRALRPLDVDFLRSQFDYYRGERAHGGLLSPEATDKGLALEAHYLRASVHSCPQNPLPVYMLGRVEWRRSHPSEARRQLTRADRLYHAAGWVPSGLRDAQHDAHMAESDPPRPRA